MMEVKHPEFAERLQMAMGPRYKARDLSSATGSTEAMAYRWVKGISKPSVDYVIPLSKFLNVSVEWLITGANAAEPPSGMDPDFSDALQRLKEAYGPSREEIELLSSVQWGRFKPTYEILVGFVGTLRAWGQPV